MITDHPGGVVRCLLNLDFGKLDALPYSPCKGPFINDVTPVREGFKIFVTSAVNPLTLFTP